MHSAKRAHSIARAIFGEGGLRKDCMTRGEALAIICMLDSCKKELSFRSIKKVARAIGIKVVDEERAYLEKLIQISLDIKKEDEA